MQHRNPTPRTAKTGPISFLRSLARRFNAPSPVAATGPRVEGLESRVVLSGGPTLTGVELLGPVNGVTSVVLTFNEPLSPTPAENVQAFAFGKPPVPNTSSNSGFSIGDIFAFRYSAHATPAVQKPKLVKLGKIQMASAVYDPTADTVTLTPYAPFKASAYFRFLRIKGSGPNALIDTLGNPLNDGKDTVARWTLHQGRTVNYHDATGNRVRLKLTGPGKLYVFTRNSKDTNPVVFVQGGTAATRLDGMLTHHGAILPVVNIAEIQGADGITNNLLNNPMFNVQTTVP